VSGELSAKAASRGRLLSLQIPLVMLLLAFTAIPTDLRIPDAWVLRRSTALDFDGADALVNTVGYMPLGVVLAARGAVRAIGTGAAVSAVAEGLQMFSAGRSPSIVDLATNIAGTALGFALCRLMRVRIAEIRIGRRIGGLAIAIALAYVGFGGRVTPSDVEDVVATFVMAPPWVPVNDRGSLSTGKLEAQWTFDAIDNAIALDTSGNGLSGRLVNRPMVVAGVHGSAIGLNGKNQWIAIGDPVALRLVGSMTISAWIKPKSFPNNDNAIVSSFNSRSRGYQLDATTDEGPPAIGFKLTNGSGQEIARYGSSRLIVNQWSHVAGVYDATRHTLDVYLNGRLDNGCLRGPVTARQHISGVPVFVGRRPRYRGEEFSGDLDDVKIYSRALSADEIAAEAQPVNVTAATASPTSEIRPCLGSQETDPRVPGLAIALGMLVAIGVAGVWPTPRYRMFAITCSLAAGLLLLLSMAAVVPPLFRWIVPLLTLAGGTGVAIAVRD